MIGRTVDLGQRKLSSPILPADKGDSTTPCGVCVVASACLSDLGGSITEAAHVRSLLVWTTAATATVPWRKESFCHANNLPDRSIDQLSQISCSLVLELRTPLPSPCYL